MKPTATLLILYALPFSVQAQTPCVQEHKGEVSLFTNKGKGLPGVPIVIDGNQGAPTDVNGVFRYRLSKCPGMSVRLKVGGDSYAIVNHIETSSYTLRKLADPSDFQFSLLVSPARQVEQDRVVYYTSLAGVALEKGLAVQKGRIDELEKLLRSQQQKNEGLIDSLAGMRSRYWQVLGEREKRLNEAKSMAVVFAQRTEVDSSYQKAFGLYKEGQFQAALAQLPDAKMQDEKQRFQAKLSMARRLEAEALKEQGFYISKCLFKATIYRSLSEPKKAEEWYREAVLTDTTQADNLIVYANFLETLNRAKEPEVWYQKALALNPAEPTKGAIFNGLGVYYTQNNQPKEAESALLQAKEIRTKLAQTNSDQYEPDLAQTLHNIGFFYTTANRVPEAETAFLQANASWEKMAQKNPDQYEPNLAQTLRSLGALHQNASRLLESEKDYLQAKAIQEKLAQKNPDRYQPDLIKTLYSLGGIYYSTNRRLEAETAYLHAKRIGEKLVQKNPDQYEPDLARTVANLGMLYNAINRVPEAEAAYLQSKALMEKLVQKNADRFDPDLSRLLTLLGIFYSNNNRVPEAETTYLQAKTLLEKLAQKNADRFDPDLAGIMSRLGLFFSSTNRSKEARAAFLQAKEIQARLTNKNAIIHGDELALTLHKLGFITSGEEREGYCREAVSVQEKVISQLKNQPSSSPTTLASALGNLSCYQLFNKQFTQAEATAQEGLALDSQEEWINTNLALAFLLQGKLEQAKAIYIRLKDKLEQGPNPGSYKKFFLEDMAELEKAGITHPDMAVIRQLLK